MWKNYFCQKLTEKKIFFKKKLNGRKIVENYSKLENLKFRIKFSKKTFFFLQISKICDFSIFQTAAHLNASILNRITPGNIQISQIRASITNVSHGPISDCRAVFQIQIFQFVTVTTQVFTRSVSDPFAAIKAQVLQIRTFWSEGAESRVMHVFTTWKYAEIKKKNVKFFLKKIESVKIKKTMCKKFWKTCKKSILNLK